MRWKTDIRIEVHVVAKCVLVIFDTSLALLVYLLQNNTAAKSHTIDFTVGVYTLFLFISSSIWTTLTNV
jgi:hypothetical protein